MLEGWAIVDNTTGEDWTNVQLSLVSGRPISFISQPLRAAVHHPPVAGAAGDRAQAPVVYEGRIEESRRGRSLRADVAAMRGGPNRMADCVGSEHGDGRDAADAARLAMQAKLRLARSVPSSDAAGAGTRRAVRIPLRARRSRCARANRRCCRFCRRS